jgi:chromosome partitioning protein
MNGLETTWGAIVLAVGNQKGGVGKTTTAVHLAHALAERGHRILLWDLDINAGATKHLGVEPDAFMGTYEVLAAGEDPLDGCSTSSTTRHDRPASRTGPQAC